MKSQDLTERILDKLDKISEEISASKEVQAEHAASLKEHMRRSEALENHLELLRSEIKPIQKHVVLIEGIFKGIGIVVSFVSLIYGLIRIASVLGVQFLN